MLSHRHEDNAITFTETGRVILRSKLVDEYTDTMLICFEVEDTQSVSGPVIGLPGLTLGAFASMLRPRASIEWTRAPVGRLPG